MIPIPEWLVRWLVVIGIAAAAAGVSFLKGIEYCEHKAEHNELEQRRNNDATLAKNRGVQVQLQDDLDAALVRLGKIRHGCLDAPHPADVECVLNFRSDPKTCP